MRSRCSCWSPWRRPPSSLDPRPVPSCGWNLVRAGARLGQTSAVTGRAELTRRAQAHGVAVSYQNWRGRSSRCRTRRWPRSSRRSGANEARRPAAGPARWAPRWRRSRPAGPGASPCSCTRCARARSWGLGDLHDLADLAAWSGGDLGADFVLVNPLHAAEPRPPMSPSPYLPMTRRFDQPALPAGRGHPRVRQARAPGDRARVEALAAPLRAASTHRGAHRPRRGLGRQAGGARADPRGAADREPPGASCDAFLRPRGRRASTTAPPGAPSPRCTVPTGGPGPRRWPTRGSAAVDRRSGASWPTGSSSTRWLQWLLDGAAGRGAAGGHAAPA